MTLAARLLHSAAASGARTFRGAWTQQQAWHAQSMHMHGAELFRMSAHSQPHAGTAAAATSQQHTAGLHTAFATAASEGVSAANRSTSHGAAGSGPQQQRLRVAVDIDEVLGRFLHTLNQYCQEEHGMTYNLNDYSVYEFYKIWGCTPERSNEIVHEFFKSPHFVRGIPVVPGAAEALHRLAATCDLMVVTSRQHAIQQSTLQWIEQHYPGVFQDVHFGNHWALEGAMRKKSEICKSIGAHLLIDDNPGYATECAEAGMQVLLYDWEHAYPWSKIPSGSMHPRITVVRDWGEVEKAVHVMAPKLLRGEEPDRFQPQ